MAAAAASGWAAPVDPEGRRDRTSASVCGGQYLVVYEAEPDEPLEDAPYCRARERQALRGPDASFMSFTVAIVGRPNVGKSTLFNRLVGRRLALVDDRPGVTRDRREGAGRLGDLEFTVVDTAGLEERRRTAFPAACARRPRPPSRRPTPYFS